MLAASLQPKQVATLPHLASNTFAASALKDKQQLFPFNFISTFNLNERRERSFANLGKDNEKVQGACLHWTYLKASHLE